MTDLKLDQVRRKLLGDLYSKCSVGIAVSQFDLQHQLKKAKRLKLVSTLCTLDQLASICKLNESLVDLEEAAKLEALSSCYINGEVDTERLQAWYQRYGTLEDDEQFEAKLEDGLEPGKDDSGNYLHVYGPKDKIEGIEGKEEESEEEESEEEESEEED